MPSRSLLSSLQPVAFIAHHRWMNPRVAKYMDRRGEEEEEKQSSLPLARNANHAAGPMPASRSEAMLKEVRKSSDKAGGGDGVLEAAAHPPGAAGGNLLANGPLKLKKKTPAIEAAAKAVAAQREKAKSTSGGGEPFTYLMRCAIGRFWPWSDADELISFADYFLFRPLIQVIPAPHPQKPTALPAVSRSRWPSRKSTSCCCLLLERANPLSRGG